MSERDIMVDIGESARQTVEQTCQRLAISFAYLVDHRRYDELVALFTEDGRYSRPGLVVQGHAELREFMLKRPLDVVTRHVCSALFFEEVTTDRAVGVAYLTFYQASGQDGEVLEARGPVAIADVRDEFVRIGNSWRIAERTVRPAFVFKADQHVK